MKISQANLRNDTLRVCGHRGIVPLCFLWRRSGFLRSRPVLEDGSSQALLQPQRGGAPMPAPPIADSPPPYPPPRVATPAPSSPPAETAPSSAAAARTKMLLEGPILPTLLRLAAPNVLTLLAFAGVITFD